MCRSFASIGPFRECVGIRKQPHTSVIGKANCARPEILPMVKSHVVDIDAVRACVSVYKRQYCCQPYVLGETTLSWMNGERFLTRSERFGHDDSLPSRIEFM
jgi:hypothetical protein